MTNTHITAENRLSDGRNRWNATDLGLIAVFAALVAGAALVPGKPGFDKPNHR